jgi:mevalonate kinase
VPASLYGTARPAQASHLGRRWALADEPDDPLSRLVLDSLECSAHTAPDLTIAITSTIPIASGMGSGAAVAIALLRAIAAHLGHLLTDAELLAQVSRSEQRYHGTASGIDSAVIAYEWPIWFVRPTQSSVVGCPLQEAITDNGQWTTGNAR